MKNLLSMTKKTFVGALAALLLVPTFMSINAHASNDEHTGVIHFSGAIVQPPCLNEINNKQITLNCLDDNADMTSNHLDIKKVTQTKGWQVINSGRGEYSYNWINEQKQLGMLTIKYI
ncbi:hypothetical protein [Providencia sp. Je.9.19]|uniref:hypothetical protein n=1 Tax=unclassified Providencia TaxID=2633465 RepID=UPI003DA9173E